MPAIKDYFDKEKGAKILERALRNARGGEKKTFAFGMGKAGAWLAMDLKDGWTTDKFLKELKKTDYKSKFVVGTAVVDGKIIQIKSVHRKNNIKPTDVRDFLGGVKTTVSRAVIDGKGEEGDEAEGEGKKK